MMRLFLATLALLPLLAGPATAHKLKVFAAIEGDAVSGYAFFIGGGRAKGTPWTAKTADGTVIATGKTDGKGRFHLQAPRPVPSDITITVDTREGHLASATLAASRFGNAPAIIEPHETHTAVSGGGAQSPLPEGEVGQNARVRGSDLSVSPPPSPPPQGRGSDASPAAITQPAPDAAAPIAPLVEAAVQRQVEPLLERIEEMDNRLRFTDTLSGIFLIVGLAGIGLWARGRR